MLTDTHDMRAVSRFRVLDINLPGIIDLLGEKAFVYFITYYYHPVQNRLYNVGLSGHLG